MDVLRVLTRSTNLNKRSSKGGSTRKHELPSAGARAHPQALKENSESAGRRQEARGLKRKRGQGAAKPDAQDLPDFFETSGPTTGEREAENESDQEVVAEPLPESSIAIAGPVVSLEERKQIWKRHKLKIHLVADGRGRDQGTQARQKRRAKEQATTKFEAIYPQPIRSFKELQHTRISKRLLDNLNEQGYTTPTEIQMAALSTFLANDLDSSQDACRISSHLDVVSVAPTGSGKTLAFLIPVMNDLLAERAASSLPSKRDTDQPSRHVRAVIVAPTHELADQIVNEARKLAEGTGLKAAAMHKGMHLYQDQGEEITEGLIKSDIVVSTPQLLANSLQSEKDQPGRDLPNISHLILDEADVLLDPMFREQTMKIWEGCTATSLRVSLWSATMGSSIEAFATDTIFQRLSHASKEAQHEHRLVRIIAGLKDSAIPNVRHHLTYAATEQGKLLAMRQLLHPSTHTSSTDPVMRPPFLVFTQTIPRAVALHSELLYDIPTEAGGASRIAVLHSDLSLSARSDIMARFRKGEIWILITTDLLSRGVDFRGVNGVVNYDIPTSGAGYVHRAGRTGRAGREGGICVTLYSKEDIPYVKSVAHVIAAAEKLKGGNLGSEGSAMPQWLLDALPNLSKEAKKDLKRKGVASRRTEKAGKINGKTTMRISTKSGYERKLENRRKPNRRGDNQLAKTNDTHERKDASDDEFGGFED